jgi:hypothetical protein
MGQHYVGPDVSLEMTSVCVLDEAGAIVWRGKVGSTPEALAAAIEAAGGGATPEGTGGERSDALRRPPQPSREPAAVVGAGPLPRGEAAASEVWARIRRHGLRNPEDRRAILAETGSRRCSARSG